MSATFGDRAYSGTLTGQCSGAFSGTDLGSGMIVSGCCTANIVVYATFMIPVRRITDHDLFSDRSTITCWDVQGPLPR